MSEKFNEYSEKIKSGINDAVSFITEQTGRVIDKTKLKMAISKESTELDVLYKKIGEHYYNIFANGGPIDEEMIETFKDVEKHIETINMLKSEL